MMLMRLEEISKYTKEYKENIQTKLADYTEAAEKQSEEIAENHTILG